MQAMYFVTSHFTNADAINPPPIYPSYTTQLYMFILLPCLLFPSPSSLPHGTITHIPPNQLINHTNPHILQKKKAFSSSPFPNFSPTPHTSHTPRYHQNSPLTPDNKNSISKPISQSPLSIPKQAGSIRMPSFGGICFSTWHRGSFGGVFM
jgi:hypothetical protein